MLFADRGPGPTSRVVQRGKFDCSMSVLGQKQTSDSRPGMSALPPKADIAARDYDVRLVPEAVMSLPPHCAADVA